VRCGRGGDELRRLGESVRTSLSIYLLVELWNNVGACHIGAMSDYQIIPDDDPARFAVKITFASGHSRIQRGFRTESDAKGWLESERNKEAARAAKRDQPT